MKKEPLLKQNEKLVKHLISSGVLKTPRIIEAFLNVPRHLFVPPEQLPYAYHDVALPTYKGQTISQPYTVAFMTELLEPREGDKILEVGAGSGWQAAILGYVVGSKGKVITIEIDEDLVEFARRNLRKVGIKNVEVVHGDGSVGYEKEAPYDRIIVTAACPDVPRPLIEQLKVGGRLVAPVGSMFGQRMLLLEKDKDGIRKSFHGSFVFVPLKGKYGFR